MLMTRHRANAPLLAFPSRHDSDTAIFGAGYNRFNIAELILHSTFLVTLPWILRIVILYSLVGISTAAVFYIALLGDMEVREWRLDA